MAKFDVVNIDNKKVSEIELSDAVFAAEPNEWAIYEVAKMQAINRRAGTVMVKNTSLVRGGGKAMGPKPRDYEYRPPKTVRRGALRSALSLRAKEKKLVIVDKFELKETSTKSVGQLLAKNLGLKGALVIEARDNQHLHRSVRNLADFDVLAPEGLNLESLLAHDTVVLTTTAAKAIEGALS